MRGARAEMGPKNFTKVSRDWVNVGVGGLDVAFGCMTLGRTRRKCWSTGFGEGRMTPANTRILSCSVELCP